jgi:phospholipase C
VAEGSSPLRTRREVLVAGLAGGFSLLLASCASSTTRRAASIKPAGSDLGAIDHVVFLMHENRSFDHYFGTYPGVRGFDDHQNGLGAFAQPWPANTTHPPAGQLLPFHLDTSSALAECTFDLSHEWAAQHASWNQGAMDAFVRTHISPAYEGPANGVLTMGHYTRADLDFYYALADAFTICDGYHCSVMGPTHPNRLHALSGTLDPAGEAGGPVLVTNSKPEWLFSAKWESMPERLEAKGISWKVYNPPGNAYQPSNPISIAISDNIMLYFSRFKDPATSLHKKAFSPLFPRDFARDVANDELPAVSWICPPVGFDEHPPAPPAAGEWFTHQVLSALVSSPKVWARTVLFVMYDENDGFFDHVAPPVPPAGTPGEFLTADPLPAAAKGVTGPIGLGFRVPMLVVSPFSRGGYVCSDTFDHTSQLRFLETRFGVEAPNISAWRRKAVGDLTSTLHVSTPDRSVPSLPATASHPAVVARECQASQLVTVDLPNPAPYPLPNPQKMPTQEPGSARPVPSS